MNKEGIEIETLVAVDELPTVMEEESARGSLIGSAYLGNVTKTVTFKEDDGKTIAKKNDEATVKSGTNRVSIRIHTVNMSYGHGRYIERPVSHIYHNVGINSFSGNLVTFKVSALLRDINGDDKWEASFRVVVECYG